MNRDYKLFLNDINECISAIERYIKDLHEEGFLKDEKTQDAVIRKIEIIGEATKNLPKSLKEKNSHIPWVDMGNFRNFITHSYYEISLKRIWNIVKKDIPIIKEEMKNIKLV
jgi:uncharacterized protein with HEPN domain